MPPGQRGLPARQHLCSHQALERLQVEQAKAVSWAAGHWTAMATRAGAGAGPTLMGCLDFGPYEPPGPPGLWLPCHTSHWGWQGPCPERTGLDRRAGTAGDTAQGSKSCLSLCSGGPPLLLPGVPQGPKPLAGSRAEMPGSLRTRPCSGAAAALRWGWCPEGAQGDRAGPASPALGPAIWAPIPGPTLPRLSPALPACRLALRGTPGGRS